MARHCESGQRVAEWLESQPGVDTVYYPGLSSHPGYEVAAKQMSGFGGMVSVRLHGGEQAARAVRRCDGRPSIGGTVGVAWLCARVRARACPFVPAPRRARARARSHM